MKQSEPSPDMHHFSHRSSIFSGASGIRLPRRLTPTPPYSEIHGLHIPGRTTQARLPKDETQDEQPPHQPFLVTATRPRASGAAGPRLSTLRAGSTDTHRKPTRRSHPEDAPSCREHPLPASDPSSSSDDTTYTRAERCHVPHGPLPRSSDNSRTAVARHLPPSLLLQSTPALDRERSTSVRLRVPLWAFVQASLSHLAPYRSRRLPACHHRPQSSPHAMAVPVSPFLI